MNSIILLSGGTGSRYGKDTPKQYSKLLGKRMICYSIEEIINGGLTNELILVYGRGFFKLIKDIIEPYESIFKTIKFVQGGKNRQESVFSGLKKCTFPTVILHESARPLITARDFINILDHKSESVTLGLDIPFTVLKTKDNCISEVLIREELFNVQLPQKFPTKKLLEFHIQAKKDGKYFTDDSSLVFNYGESVAVIPGSSENIKITTPRDFYIGENILKNRLKNK